MGCYKWDPLLSRAMLEAKDIGLPCSSFTKGLRRTFLSLKDSDKKLCSEAQASSGAFSTELPLFRLLRSSVTVNVLWHLRDSASMMSSHTLAGLD